MQRMRQEPLLHGGCTSDGEDFLVFHSGVFWQGEWYWKSHPERVRDP